MLFFSVSQVESQLNLLGLESFLFIYFFLNRKHSCGVGRKKRRHLGAHSTRSSWDLDGILLIELGSINVFRCF